MKVVEIEVIIVDKVVSNVFIDGGSGFNIMLFYIMEKLGLNLIGFLLFVLNMVD